MGILFESLLQLDFVDILGNVKLFEVRPKISFVVVFHHGANSSSKCKKCKRYVVFSLFDVTRVN